MYVSRSDEAIIGQLNGAGLAATATIISNRSRMENLKQLRFGLDSVMSIPHAAGRGSVYRGGRLPALLSTVHYASEHEP